MRTKSIFENERRRRRARARKRSERKGAREPGCQGPRGGDANGGRRGQAGSSFGALARPIGRVFGFVPSSGVRVSPPLFRPRPREWEKGTYRVASSDEVQEGDELVEVEVVRELERLAHVRFGVERARHALDARRARRHLGARTRRSARQIQRARQRGAERRHARRHPRGLGGRIAVQQPEQIALAGEVHRGRPDAAIGQIGPEIRRQSRAQATPRLASGSPRGAGPQQGRAPARAARRRPARATRGRAGGGGQRGGRGSGERDEPSRDARRWAAQSPSRLEGIPRIHARVRSGWGRARGVRDGRGGMRGGGAPVRGASAGRARAGEGEGRGRRARQV